MAAEVMLVGVAKVVLEEGAKFLYEQAGKVLDAWRARRKDPGAPPAVVVAAPPDVTVGAPQPTKAVPDAETFHTLQDLRADAERIANGQMSADDPAARAKIAALRDILEAALGTSISLAGEADRPLRVSDVKTVANDVRGRLTGVRVADGQGATVSGVDVNVHDIEAGGEVVGVDIGGGQPQPGRARADRRPITILFLAANPADTGPLRLGEEMREIDRALRASEYRDRFEIKQQWAVQIGDLHEALLRHQPDIVHFSGHGTEESEILVEDETGAGRSVPQAELSRLFSVLRDNIRCVVLNACWSEQQAQAIATHIDCVVGMTRAVGDAGAIQFAVGFYRALGFGRNVQTAFDLGTNQIGLLQLPDGTTPRLVAKRAAKATEVSFVTELN